MLISDPVTQNKMGASRADKELYFQKLKELLDKYRESPAKHLHPTVNY
jgi:hypothetical protein